MPGGKHPKLDKNQTVALVRLHNDGVTLDELTRRFNVSRASVLRTLKRGRGEQTLTDEQAADALARRRAGATVAVLAHDYGVSQAICHAAGDRVVEPDKAPGMRAVKAAQADAEAAGASARADGVQSVPSDPACRAAAGPAPLPAGHPNTWSLLVRGTILEGAHFEPLTPYR